MIKISTLEKIKDALDGKKIEFCEDTPNILIALTNGEICDIIASEYGIRPKRQRIRKKKLQQIFNRLLEGVLEEARKIK